MTVTSPQVLQSQCSSSVLVVCAALLLWYQPAADFHQSGGSMMRNSLEMSPRPLNSPDCPEENRSVPESHQVDGGKVPESHQVDGGKVPESHQGEDLIDIKVEVIDEAEETMDLWANPQDGSRRNPPERCPRPLCPQDGPEESHSVPESHQGEHLIIVKVEDEEVMTSGDRLCVSDGKKETPEVVTTENLVQNSEGNLMLLKYKVEDEDIKLQCADGNVITLIENSGLYSTDLIQNPEEPSDQSHIVTSSKSPTGAQGFQCGGRVIKSSEPFEPRRIRTGEKPYSCSECGKCLSDKASLRRHEKCHTGERPYSCTECGKCFTLKSGYIMHQRVHTGEKPHPCMECGKCFITKTKLKEHYRIHTGEKPFPCSVCGKCFRSQSCLLSHMKIHTREKPYSCSECGKCFKYKSGFIMHQRVHSGEKPYSCSECGKCFITQAKLRDHYPIHTGERPFPCSVCGKCFISPSSIRSHEKIHEGKKHSCSLCTKCFSKKSSLVKHQRIHVGKS